MTKTKKTKASAAEPATEVYTIVLEWGQDDEGLYHWSGRATSEDEAIRLAREDADRAYNEDYTTDDDKELLRGIAADEETTDYVVSDIISGVNEYAAKDMLDVLRTIHQTYILDDEHAKMLEHAIGRGEGRIDA